MQNRKKKKEDRFIVLSFRLCGRRRGWDVSPAQVGCMRQALGPGALGKPRGNGWIGRWEGGFGWGTHVNPWLLHFNV